MINFCSNSVNFNGKHIIQTSGYRMASDVKKGIKQATKGISETDVKIGLLDHTVKLKTPFNVHQDRSLLQQAMEAIYTRASKVDHRSRSNRIQSLNKAAQVVSQYMSKFNEYI